MTAATPFFNIKYTFYSKRWYAPGCMFGCFSIVSEINIGNIIQQHFKEESIYG
nr:MAG TPA: hypothetical protein [Caudoviricetes sp.]